MIDQELLKRMVYVKYMYIHACEILDKDLPVTYGMALNFFQDSTEMMLRIIGEHVDANIKPVDNFHNVIQSIEKGKKNSNHTQVPKKIFLNKLNSARVQFKHNGLLPEPEDVKRFKNDLFDFFHEAMKLFFDLNFEKISLSDLISNQRVKNHLKQAEIHIDDENYQESIISSAKSFKLIYHKILNNIGYRPHYHHTSELDRELADTIEKMKTLIIEHDSQLVLLKFGVNLAEFSRFESIIPHVWLTDANTFIVQEKNSKDTWTAENAQFGIRFTFDLALQHQKYNHLHKNIRTINPTIKYKVIKEAPIIVYPGDKCKEEIRIAQKNEIIWGHNNNTKENYSQIIEADDLSYIDKDSIEEIMRCVR